MTLTIKASALCELLNRAIPFVGKDETLPILLAIEIEVADGYLTVTSTDRYRLAHARTKVEDDAEPWKFLLKVADAKKIVRLFSPARKPRPPFPPEVSLSVNDSEITVAGAGVRLDGSHLSLSFTAQEGDYLKWRGLIPRGIPTDPAVVNLNPRYLADFEKVARFNIPLRVTVFEAHKPILVETEDFVGLLMPVRLSDETMLGFEVLTGDEIHIGVTIDPNFGVEAVAS